MTTLHLQDLVEQVTTTTGTGTYTVSGSAPQYRRTWLAAFPADQVDIPYVVCDSAGNYECGLGAWVAASQTLARTVILRSSNGNTEVSWAAGSKKIYSGPSALLGELVSVRHNAVAVAAPTVNDDTADGYRVGSLWLYAGAIYLCTDATLGAAAWSKQAYIRTVNGFQVIKERTAYNDSATYQATGYFFSGASFNGLFTSSGGFDYYADGGVGTLGVRTTNATPTKLGAGGNWATNGGIPCPNTSAMTISGVVTAYEKGAAGYASWKVEALVTTNGSGTVTIRAGGTPTIIDDGGTLNAAASSIALVASSGDITVQVTGIAATDITWSATLTVAISIVD